MLSAFSRHPLPSLLLVTLIAGCTVSPLSIDKEWGATGTGGANTSSTTDNGGSTSEDGSDPSTGGTKASSTTKSAGGTKSTGGTTGAGGTKSIGGTTGAGGTSTVGTTTPPPACLGNPLPMPANGFVAANSNGCGITGSWYWYKDKIEGTVTDETDVTLPPTAGTPVISTGGAVCLEGHTVAVEGAWGAGIGINLDNPLGTAKTYDLTAHGIGGFEVTVTGEFPQGLRMNFADATANIAAPFVPMARPGTYRIMLADAFVPIGWDTSVAGTGVVPTAVGQLQFQVVGGQLDKNFKFCVTSVIPLPVVDDGSMGTKPVSFVSLPIDADGIATADTSLSIQGGRYYCALPSGVPFQCGAAADSLANAFNPTLGNLYLASSMGTDYTIWGGTIGLNLNYTTVVDRWNGTVHKLRGFRYTTKMTSSSPLPIRFATSSVATLAVDTVSPFVEHARAGTHVVEMGSLECPKWSGLACTEPDLSALYFLEFQVPTLLKATPYEFQISSLEAMIAR